MSRPADWSPLGLSSDPTPGDPSQVQDVLSLLKTMADDFQTIYDTLNTVNGYAASDNLVGKTADALRAQMNNRLTKFVSSAQAAFTQAAAAMTTYSTAIAAHQQTADGLLTQAQNSGLKKDDPQIKSWAQQAQQAGTDLQTAENTAAHAIQSLPGPYDPLSPWQEFLQILGWLALLLILPAMIFGGPIALIELVVNAVLFVNALVQFAEGNISFGQLLLAALGVIAPTTRALDLGAIVDLIKGIGSSVKSGIVVVRSGLGDFIDLLTSAKLSDLFTPESLAALGNFVLKAGVWVFTGLKNLPAALLKSGVLVSSKLGELLLTGVEHITTSLKTGSWLSAFLPVDATEIAKLGLGEAFRLGFLERGLLISSNPARDLSILNKMSFAGIHTGTINPEGFGHLNPPNLTSASWKVPATANAHVPNLGNDFKALNLDTHLQAPTLSMGNLAAAFQHGSMDVGTISIRVPNTTIHIGHLEVPDLRNPPELSRIGQGTVITHFSDVSMVTVHEDLVPQAAHMDLGGVTVPGMHTGDITIPSLHSGTIDNASVHVGSVGANNAHLSAPATSTGTTHLAQNFHTPTQVPGLHGGSISVPSLHTPDISGIGAHNLGAHSLPDLSTIAHVKINTADTTATTLSHTDTSLSLTTDAHLGTEATVSVSQTDALSHLAPPTVATPHLTEPGATTVGHVATPTVSTPHLTESGAAVTGHVATPTITTPHLTDPGAAATPHLTGSGTNLAAAHTTADAVPTNLPNLHVAAPDTTALAHLAEGAPAMAVHPVAPLRGPQFGPVRLSDAPHGQTGGAAEIKTMQNIPEAQVQFSDAGVHGKVGDIQSAAPETDLGKVSQDTNSTVAVSAHTAPQTTPVGGHGESSAVPAVSSSSAEDGLAHSAGAGGGHAATPDLAGKPGLIDANAARVAVPWAAFKQAQHDYHTALADHELAFPKPDKEGVGPSGGNGKAPQTAAQSAAEHQLHVTAESLNDAAAVLHKLGIDPAQLTALEHAALTESLTARPRLVGGSRPGDAVLATHPYDGSPALTTRGVGGNLRLFIDRGGAAEHGLLLNVDSGLHVDTGHLVEAGEHGGFRLHDPGDPAVFREYRPDGTLHATGLQATDHLDQPIGSLVVFHGTGHADFHPAGGAPLNGLRHEAAEGGGHLVVDDANQNWWRFDGAGALTHQGMAIEHGEPIGATHLEIDFGGSSAQTFAHGNPHGAWGYTEHAGSFSLHDAGGDTFHFDENGSLIAHDLAMRNPDGLAADTVIRIDHTDPARPGFSVHDPNGEVAHMNVSRVGDGNGSFTVTDTRNSSRGVFDGRGRLVEQSFGTVGHDGTPLGDLHIDYGTGTARFAPPGAAARDWRFTSTENGFTLAADGGHELSFGHEGTLLGEHVPLRDFRGDTGTHIRADYRDPANPVLALHGQNGPLAQFQVELSAVDRFRVFDATGTSWRGYNRGGGLTAQNLRVADHTGAHLDTITVDYAAGHADVNAFGYGYQRWNYAGQGDGFTLTHLGNELGFDNAGRLRSLSFETQGGLQHATQGAHIHADFAGPHGPVFEVRGGDNAPIGHFQVTRTPDGHFVVTDTRAGQTHGAFTEYEQYTGVVRNERVNLLDQGGMHVQIDHLDPAPGHQLPLHDANGPVGHFNAVRDPAGNHITVTDTRGAHTGDTKVFDEHGAPVSEHITITDKRGNATGESFHVDFGAMRWTRERGGVRVQAFGHNMNTADAVGLAHGYNTAGAAVLKRDGSLVLTGEDKTPAYLREPLSDGQTLEVLRQPDGKRVWTTWDHAGPTGAHGVRHFSTESDGVTSWDVGNWGETVRQYRTAIDGGTVRAERLPGGTFRWSRYTKDGDLALSGTRTQRPWGWTDKVAGGEVVQKKWSAFNFFAHASHYREYGVARNAATDAFVLKSSYKEISAQAKDTGSKEVLAGGHTLTFTRYAEQRPPDFLWKTPDNIDNAASKGLAKVIGSKYGAIDFPHDGLFHGDSRFQVFKWKEHDPADGSVVSHGVRVYTPDGSFSDFAGDGVLVRGAIKLDNGHTVEIGRDGAGKWDSVQLGPAGERPGDGTLNWRQLDGDKNVVAQGTRNFEGKHWIDTFTAEDGTVRVARHTTGEGDVVHYQGETKPAYDPAQAVGHRIVPGGNETSITRNTTGQLVQRTEGWGEVVNRAVPVRVTGHGDPRTGDWQWHSNLGTRGVRVSARNSHGAGAWDDSFRDFRLNADGKPVLTHEFHALDKGTSLRAEQDAGGIWRSMKFDAQGRPQNATSAVRQWKQADGSFGRARPVGRQEVPWRDTVEGDVVRELVDGRVREYTGGGTHTWKEYDFGSVWRERSAFPGRDGLYLEKESFQKQWRVTNAQGTLLRYRSAAGRVYERNSFGTWKLVGTEREDKGLLTQFRGANRRMREPNRYQFTITDGTSGAFQSTASKLGEKTILDFVQEFTIDVGANIIIIGATNGWNFNGAEWGRILLGGAIRAGIKGGYGLLSETVLKDLRDGLRNMDGGKDFNRNPYNNDKHWDNEWAGNENPQRWRSGVFDYGVGNVLVPSFGSAAATLFTSLAFGVGENGTRLDFAQLMQATGLAFAGGLASNLTAGAVKFGAHQLFSGRLFHQGGLPDITFAFGEKLFLDFLVNEVMLPHIHTTASTVLKTN